MITPSFYQDCYLNTSLGTPNSVCHSEVIGKVKCETGGLITQTQEAQCQLTWLRIPALTDIAIPFEDTMVIISEVIGAHNRRLD